MARGSRQADTQSAHSWRMQHRRSPTFLACPPLSAWMGGCRNGQSFRRTEMAERRIRGLAGLQQAFDEARFGSERTLNLRASLPTGAEAAQRLENWLRQHQVSRSLEVLIITGRGNNSDDGVSKVREASIRVFHELRRK